MSSSAERIMNEKEERNEEVVLNHFIIDILIGMRLSLTFSKVTKAITRPFSSHYVSHRDSVSNNDHIPFDFSAENYKEVNKILSRYPSNYKKSAILPLLFVAQKQNDNFLSLSAMKKVAQVCEVPEMDVFEVASFYTMYNRERVGKFHLQFCGTTPCMLCGSREVMKAAEDHLGVKVGETTPDGLFTLQEVECLGACVNAPMIQVNNEWVYEDLTPETMVQLIEDFKSGKEVKKGPQTQRNGCEGPLGRTSLTEKPKKEVRFERDFAAAKKKWEEEKAAAVQAAKK